MRTCRLFSRDVWISFNLDLHVLLAVLKADKIYYEVHRNLLIPHSIPGRAFHGLSQSVPASLEVGTALLLRPPLRRLGLHVKEVHLARQPCQLLRYLHSCHHRLWSLLCFQSSFKPERLHVQTASERDAGSQGLGGAEDINCGLWNRERPPGHS